MLDEASTVVRRGWSQFHVATDVEGRALKSARDPGAVAVCSLGAIDVAASDLDVDVDVRAEALRVFGAYVTNGSSVAHWNEIHGQSADYVAQKLHAAAREYVRGGPVHVGAAVPAIPAPGSVPPDVAPRRKPREFSPEGALRQERGRLVGTLQNQRRNDRPEADIAATEGRIRSVDKRLRDEFGVDMPEPPAGLSSPPPPPRRPGTESGL